MPPGKQELALLVDAARRGDTGAQDRLLQLHLPLVMRLAAARADRGLALGDLFQEGSLALMLYIRQRSEATTFSSDAENEIGRHLDRALAVADAALKEDEALLAAATEFDRVELLLARMLHRRPTVAEMAEKLEWPVERVESIGTLVEDARRRHDEEIAQFLDPAEAEPRSPGGAVDGHRA